eukprot:2549371-Rhodomonas_salina.1
MKDSVHKVAKDSGSYMMSLQHHAGVINSWELDDVDAWIKRTEILQQDLLHVGYAKSIADDCIVGNLNLLNALKSVPNSVQHCDEWKFAGMSWKTEQAKNHSTKWLILKSLMEAEIMSYHDDDSKDSCSARKKPKINCPVGMALLASQLGSAVEGMTALSAQFNNDMSACPHPC